MLMRDPETGEARVVLLASAFENESGAMKEASA